MPATRTKSVEKPKSILKKAQGISESVSVLKRKSREDGKAIVKGVKTSSSARGTKRDRLAEKSVASKKLAKQDTSAEFNGSSKNSKALAKEADKVTTEVVESEEEEGGGKEEEDVTQANESESEDDSDEDDDGEILHGLSDLSDADSSDQDDDGSIGEITKSGVVKLPSSRDDAAVKSRLDHVHKKKKESGRSSTPIVLYFGRVPKSMPEEPLRTYLSQFGNISRLRLSRNRKTGASKHYAFVEFEDEEVGQIVQETMNNYLLEGRLLQVRILPKEKVHSALWIGADRKWRKVPEARRFRVAHDDAKTPEEKEKVQRKLLKRQDQRREKIKSQGIDYDFEGYA